MSVDPSKSPGEPKALASVRAELTLAALASLAVLAVLLGFTYLSWQRATLADEEERRADFEFRVRDAAARVEARMEAYEQVLRGAAGLFRASASVSRPAFRDYAAALHLEEHYPGIQGVGFAQLVPARSLDAHVAQVRGEGFPDYSVRPPGPRDPYSSILYLEPFRDRNLRAFGYDMFSDGRACRGGRSSRTTRRPAPSGASRT